MKYFNIIFLVVNIFLASKLIPTMIVNASLPTLGDRDLIMNMDSITIQAQTVTAPIFSSEEDKLDHFSLWYNENNFLLQELLNDARKLKGASVRAMVAKETTNDIPWMRIVYDDCRSGKCVTVNYGHIEPVKIGEQWHLRPKLYPNAHEKSFLGTTIVLKPPQDIPEGYRQYVQQFYPLALEHDRKYGLPWQVKMAQAILESSAGNSRLARKAHQHFAIKAWSGWKGNTLDNGDEGTKQWKFIKHNSDNESWDFHSYFLANFDRYNGVFQYNPDSIYQYKYSPMAKNYWGKGYKPVFHKVNGKIVQLKAGAVYTLSGLDCATIELSRAGYATDYKYSIALMKIINSISQKYPPN